MQYISLNQSNRVLRTLRSKCFVDVRTKSTAQKLAHQVYGPSPTPSCVPIIVLHDCLGTKSNWEMICKKLLIAYKTPVIAVDARNHGNSPFCDTHDYPSLAADVLELYSHFEIEKGVIIGHSMGGRTGMVLALNKPNRVAGLIAVDISPISTSTFLTNYFPKMIDVLQTVKFKGLSFDEAKKAAREKILEHNLLQSDEEIQALLMNIGRLPDQSIGWKFNLKTLQKQFDNIATFPEVQPTLKTYLGPTLFLAGKLSYCVPPEDLSGIHDLFPSAKLIYIDGVGHNVHVEDPDGLVSAVVNSFDYDAVLKTPS